MKKYLIISLFAALTSCERIVEFNGTARPSKMYVDSQFGPIIGQSFNTYNHNNRIDFPEHTHFIEVKQAAFMFGGEVPQTIDNPELKIRLNGAEIPVEVDVDGSGTIYRHFHTPLNAGDRLDFEGYDPTLGRVMASDVVPVAAIIKNIKIEQFDEQGQSRTRALITIADPAGEKNYYAVRAYRIEHYIAKDSRWDPATQALVSEIKKYDVVEPTSVYTNHEMLFSRLDNQPSDSEQWSCISDELIDGRDYTLNVSVQGIAPVEVTEEMEDWLAAPNTGGNRIFGTSLRVEILSLSETLFKHRRSRDIAQAADSFSEPTRVFYNITGGYGIFGTYNVASKMVSL